MALTIPIDVEQHVSAHLRATTDITDLVDDRVYTAIPSKATYPLIRVMRVASLPIETGLPFIVDQVDVQVDCYGGSKRTALQLAELSRQAMLEMVGDNVYDLPQNGTVVDVNYTTLGYLEDFDQQPPRPRYVLEATVTTRMGTAPAVGPIPVFTVGDSGFPASPEDGYCHIDSAPGVPVIYLRLAGSWVVQGSTNLTSTFAAFAASTPADGSTYGSLLIPSSGDPREYEAWKWSGSAWVPGSFTLSFTVPSGTPVWPEGRLF